MTDARLTRACRADGTLAPEETARI